MKRFILSLLLLFTFPINSFAQRVTALPADTSPTSDDLMMTVDDVAGTPTSKKVTLQNAKTFFLNGNATTATALSANGANCSAGSYPLGVDASGAVESCTVASVNPWLATSVGIGTYDKVGIGTVLNQGKLAVMSGNMGIGTWNPIQALEVIGTVKATAIRATGISGSTQCVQADTNGNLSGTGSACGGAGSTPGGGLNAVQYNSPVGTFAGNESVLSNNGTNVGVGTTNGINGKLDVRGNQYVSGNIGIGGASATSVPLNVTGAANISGNLGVGASNGGYALDVLGTNRFRGASYNFYSNERTASGDLADGWSLSSGNDSLTIFPSSDTGAAGKKIVMAYFDATSWKSALEFANTSGATANLALLKGGGNVGINTSVPSSPLYVAGTMETRGFKMQGNGGSAGRVLVTDSLGVGSWMPPSDIVASGSGSGTVSSGTADRVAIYDTAGTTVTSSSVITDDNTNIGIGSTAPQSKLVVNQGLSASTTPLAVFANNNNFAEINIQNLSNGASASSDFVATSDNGNASTNYIDMGVNGSGGGAAPFTGANHGYLYTSHFPLNLGAIGANSYITFNTGATPTEYMRVDQQGNVGIGSVNPVTKLEVIGTAKATALRATGISGSTQCVQADTNGNLSGTGSACGAGGGSNYWVLGSGNGVANIGIGTTVNGVGIGTTFGNAQLAVMSGNVGVGTWNPQQDVDVKGNTVVSGNIGIGTTYGNAKLAIMSGPVGIGTWNPGSGFVITNGFVGIGSTFPSQPVSVISGGNTVHLGTSTLDWNNGTTIFIRNLSQSPSAGLTLVGANAIGGGLTLTSTITASASSTDFINFKGGTNGATTYATIRGGNLMGIGTVAPIAKLNIVGNVGIGTGQSSLYSYASAPPNGGMIIEKNVGIGTLAPTAWLAVRDFINTKQVTAPTIGTCGTSPSLGTGSTDANGFMTIGTGGIATSCAITFGHTWTKAPSCVCNHQGAILFTRAVATTTTLTCDALTALTDSGRMDYVCFGNE